MQLEHPDSQRIINAMIERLRYLEVADIPWGHETRTILWQMYCAGLASRPASEGTSERYCTDCGAVELEDGAGIVHAENCTHGDLAVAVRPFVPLDMSTPAEQRPTPTTRSASEARPPHTPDYGAPGHPKHWCERCRLDAAASEARGSGTVEVVQVLAFAIRRLVQVELKDVDDPMRDFEVALRAVLRDRSERQEIIPQKSASEAAVSDELEAILGSRPRHDCAGWDCANCHERDNAIRDLIAAGGQGSGTPGGRCCACGYTGTNESPCPKSPDGSHCEHWYDGPDIIEAAWGVIANVSGSDWTKQSPEWQQAAARWRDLYHDHLTPAAPTEQTR